MAAQERGPALNPDPHTALAEKTPTSSTSTVVEERGRPPGTWPDEPHDEQLRNQWMREHARRELVHDSIRQHLAEQPSPRSVRACARRWAADVHYLADGVIAAMNQEHE